VSAPNPSDDGTPAAVTKGQRTVARVLDAAEGLFAERGFEGASLREIARRAGIQQPGLYNYFESKQSLYTAVLDRALQPMSRAIASQLEAASDPGAMPAALPAVMTDILLEHPKMAALFQRALQGDPESLGNRLVMDWLDRLFAEGLAALERAGAGSLDRVDLALQTIAMFNLTTGFFLAERVFETMAGGRISDPEVVARQKRLLDRIARATLGDGSSAVDSGPRTTR